jgi:hypothetical protein
MPVDYRACAYSTRCDSDELHVVATTSVENGRQNRDRPHSAELGGGVGAFEIYPEEAPREIVCGRNVLIGRPWDDARRT